MLSSHVNGIAINSILHEAGRGFLFFSRHDRDSYAIQGYLRIDRLELNNV